MPDEDAPAVLAPDDFERTVADGRGSAPTGGSRLLTSTTTKYSIADGAASMVVQPGRGPNAYLTEVSSTDTAFRTTVRALDGMTGRGLYLYVTPRRVAWVAGTAEPEGWLRSATDATAALQKPGGLALNAYLSIRADEPVEVLFDDLTAVSR